MLRKLLMLMALLSGLTALCAPERALAADNAVSRAAAELCDSKKDEARCECFTTIRLRDWRLVLERQCHPRAPIIPVPSVYYGIDRAFE
jgi:hypothetical protein